MKKIIVLSLVLILVLSITACNTDVDTNPNGDTSGDLANEDLEVILEKIYDTAEISDSFKEFISTGLNTTDITSENSEYHLGKADLPYEEAIASVPNISPSAYELCLVRVKDGEDVVQVKDDIKNNVDPYKWVCVGVDDENVIVDSIGNTVVLIMSNEEAEALHNAFTALK